MIFVFKDGKIEAEDFTSRLYRELNSSPQPYLVPFLKVIVKSSPAPPPPPCGLTYWQVAVGLLEGRRGTLVSPLGLRAKSAL